MVHWAWGMQAHMLWCCILDQGIPHEAALIRGSQCEASLQV